MSNSVLARINEYLELGGLVNPELADHNAVRNLLMDCREELLSNQDLIWRCAPYKDEKWGDHFLNDLLEKGVTWKELGEHLEEVVEAAIDMLDGNDDADEPPSKVVQGSELYRKLSEHLRKED